MKCKNVWNEMQNANVCSINTNECQCMQMCSLGLMSNMNPIVLFKLWPDQKFGVYIKYVSVVYDI